MPQTSRAELPSCLSNTFCLPVCRTLPLAQGLGSIFRLSWCTKLDTFIWESFPRAFIFCSGCRGCGALSALAVGRGSSGHPVVSGDHGVMGNHPCIFPLETWDVPLLRGLCQSPRLGAELEDDHPPTTSSSLWKAAPDSPWNLLS